VSGEEGLEFAIKNNVHFFEVSAIKNKNIEEAFDIMA
jgi:hypothetical protein